VQPNEDFLNKHLATLFRLKHWQKTGDSLLFYNQSKFEQNKDKFDNATVIYAKRHPVNGIRGKNLDEILKEVDGVKVGYTSEPGPDPNKPEFLAFLNITDPETDLKIKNKELDISTSIWHSGANMGDMENPSCDHVLLYDKALGIEQGDAGALIQNQSNQNNKTDFFSYSEGSFGATNMVEKDPVKEPIKEVDPVKEWLVQNQAALTQSEATVLKLQDEKKETEKLVQNQETKITELETKINDMVKERLIQNQNDLWNSLLEGTRTTFEGRKDELLDPFKSSAFAKELILHERSLEKPPLGPAQGNQNLVNNQKSDETDEMKEVIEALNKIKQIVGR
jgi:hypothetical protein